MAAYFAPLLLYLVNPIQRTIIVPSNVSHTKRSRETVSLTFSEQKTSITIPGLTLLLSAELRSRDITQAVHNRIISLTQSLDLACAFKYTEIIDTIIWERNEFHCPGPKQEASKAFRFSFVGKMAQVRPTQPLLLFSVLCSRERGSSYSLQYISVLPSLICPVSRNPHAASLVHGSPHEVGFGVSLGKLWQFFFFPFEFVILRASHLVAFGSFHVASFRNDNSIILSYRFGILTTHFETLHTRGQTGGRFFIFGLLLLLLLVVVPASVCFRPRRCCCCHCCGLKFIWSTSKYKVD